MIHSPQIVATLGLNPDDNLLIHGDATQALEALAGQPPYAERLLGKAKLAYLDPPFNAGHNFPHYADNMDHFTWNTRLSETLALVRRFLADDGSVWLHLDDSEQHRARLLLDDVFGAESFVATLIWERSRMPRLGSKPFAIRHDYLHVYRKSDAFHLSGRADRPVEAIWSCSEVGSTEEGATESRRLFGEPFSTPKPERLLKRVIELATAPGDLVLDCFAGSGTTPAVAHKLGRRWLAVEAESATTEHFIYRRMQKVVDGSDQGGISGNVGWVGGGGFTHLEVSGPSCEDLRPPPGSKVRKERKTSGLSAPPRWR